MIRSRIKQKPNHPAIGLRQFVDFGFAELQLFCLAVDDREADEVGPQPSQFLLACFVGVGRIRQREFPVIEF